MSHAVNPADVPQGGRTAIIVKGYPRLSETFVSQELLSLQENGLEFTIYSLRHPYDDRTHELNARITAPVHYLPEYLYQEPLRVLRGLYRAFRMPGFGKAVRAWLKDMRRDLTPNRGRRFGQALVLAAELPEDTARLYVHFLHTPASVTRYAALIRGLPWSCSAHAKDIYTTPDWEKAEKLADMDWLATCTAANVAYLRDVAPGSRDKIHLVYHGLDYDRFPAPPDKRPGRDGADPEAPVVLLSVGRAVAKKGYDDLIEALARLPRELNWRFIHIGKGGERDRLKAMAARAGIGERITWMGARAHGDVITAYRSADLFVLASKIADDGDRDGLPNVLMEAQCQDLACVSTAVSAIPELIEHERTGLLVPPGDVDALSQAVLRMISEPDLRLALGQAGGRKVRSKFAHHTGMNLLYEKFGLPPMRTALSSADTTCTGRDENRILRSA